jgi:hypothetical protein
MPIRIGDHTFADFKRAVRYIAQSKHWSMDRAARYVAVIERKQNKPGVKVSAKKLHTS